MTDEFPAAGSIALVIKGLKVEVAWNNRPLGHRIDSGRHSWNVGSAHSWGQVVHPGPCCVEDGWWGGGGKDGWKFFGVPTGPGGVQGLQQIYQKPSRWVVVLNHVVWVIVGIGGGEGSMDSCVGLPIVWSGSISRREADNKLGTIGLALSVARKDGNENLEHLRFPVLMNSPLCDAVFIASSEAGLAVDQIHFYVGSGQLALRSFAA
ncbi:hypothetical protein B0H15DRAFT_803630 [Mycena belliarum]|uniref:Uncharacterized protein n=1 Tax=Mycena belliarum TaxID=1033014 RepID=A0AAD6U0A7_9AGAR|nr:hypothetical protein B0H15DRAFT_803630 [Mycena belliae]